VTIAATTSPRTRRRGLRILAWTAGILGLVLVVLIGTVSGFASYTIRRSFPQVSGSIALAGLSAPVQVVRDGLGIPTIYADTLHDLSFAQGFVHAQDRFWEMDVRRHITSGRLSEMFGASQVPTDAFLRTLGWRRIAEQELTMLSPRSLMILQSYAEGVNAYLQGRDKADVSLEYSVLGVQNPDYVIEPWVPADSVAWLKALAWDLRGNMSDEIYRAVMSASAGIDNTEQLFPPYPYDRHRPIVVGGAVVDGRFIGPNGEAVTSPTGYTIPAEAVPALQSVLMASEPLDAWLGDSGRGIGSNSFAVSGAHTESGRPLLANDPHLAASMPSLWYQAGLRCRTVGPDCDYDVAGWTMAGIPGVFIGHNARIAWGFTNLGPDVTDLVLHKVTADSYLVDGVQVPMTIREETIKVAGGDPVVITVRDTADGPIISDVADAGDTFDVVGTDAPVPAPGQADSGTSTPDRGTGYAVALRWTALTPRPTYDGFDLINTAATFEDFRRAALKVAVPAQNLLYADVDGMIAYQAPGAIPIRGGYDGKWPVPGWSSTYRWNGFIPSLALPNVQNPAEGWIVTANQAIVTPDYPYFVTDDWSYGSRSQRIIDRITALINGGRRISGADLRDIQMDSWNENAAYLVPRMLTLPATQQAVPKEAVDLLAGWDFTQPRDSAAAAYFNAFWKNLIDITINAESGTDVISASGDDQFFEVFRGLWSAPTSLWWDDRRTPEVEGRDATIAAALTLAYDEMVSLQGSDPSRWRWGAMHTLLLQNQTLGASGIAPIEALFNRGPIETSGGSGIVNATGWTPSEGYTVNWVPSMRMVVDLADFDRSTWVNLTGNSGHAFDATYDDQVWAWQNGEQFRWSWSAQAIDAAAVAELELVPAG
jgi:penicillin amidase